jgi:hypothetical protein
MAGPTVWLIGDKTRIGILCTLSVAARQNIAEIHHKLNLPRKTTLRPTFGSVTAHFNCTNLRNYPDYEGYAT